MRVMRLGNAIQNYIKSRIAKKILAKFFIPVFLPVLGIAALAVFVLGLVYYVTPEGGLYAKPTVTKEDEALKKKYMALADKYNRIDRWLVTGESSGGNLWYDRVRSDRPGSGTNCQDVKDRDLIDHYGRDAELFETFGQIHSASVFQVLNYHLDMDDITDEFREKTASDFRPYLYYKPSTITVSCTDGEGNTSTSTTHIFLLVESNTLSGHRVYHYEWTTRSSGNCTYTYEIPVGEELVSEEWERLDKWVAETYQLEGDSIEMARKSIWEAGTGYTQSKANMEWLFSVSKSIATRGMIPTEILAAISKVSQETGIPEWFLAALAFKESSFDPLAENPSGAFGLFQLMPAEQRWTTDILIAQGRIPEWFLKDREVNDAFYRAAMADPLINTMAAVLVLQSKGLKDIDWEGDWKKQTYHVLAAYGGYTDPAEAESYVREIQRMAEAFKKQKVRPVNGEITAYFGEHGGNWSGGHHGVDFGVKEGTPVLSAAGGVVTLAGWNGVYGKCVIISNGVYEFLYGHLSEIAVKEGDKIPAGKIIGYSGDTGKSTGPHLHFEIREGGRAIDPLLWLSM